MTLREFWRFHFLKVLLILVVIQIGVIAYIQNYNHVPVANTDNTSVIENREVKINPLVNDTDEDEETELSIESLEQPLHGNVKQSGNLVYYQPNEDYFGLDSFQYSITDGDKVSELAYITIDVLENMAPVTRADTTIVYSGKTIFINPLSNDEDHEDDSIYIADFTQPLKGTLVKTENGFYYTANANAVGVDSMSYCVADVKRKSKYTKVVFYIHSTQSNLYPWLTADIGNAAVKGSTVRRGGKFTIRGSGRDIWQREDGFRYLYQFIDGDCEMIAKVESLFGSNGWAKTGIMIREDLSGGSKHSFVVLSNKNGATVHQRVEQNNNTIGTEGLPEISAPYWVKIKRVGNQFTYSISDNGKIWNDIDTLENNLSKQVYIGVVCTSHNNEELAEAVYSNIILKASEVYR